MKATHLYGRAKIVCHSPAVSPNLTTSLTDVTCSWCLHTLERLHRDESSAAWDRKWLANAAADCEAAGMGHIWAVVNGETEYDQMIRGVIASVARYFVETNRAAQLRVVS